MRDFTLTICGWNIGTDGNKMHQGVKGKKRENNNEVVRDDPLQ